MKKAMFLACILATSSLGHTAYAGDDCYVPMSKWQSRDAVREMAQAQGWEVRRIKIDDGCYEIKGYDAVGREIEVKIDPASLAVVDFEYEDDDDDDDSRNRNNRPKAAPSGVITPVRPPNNGLFTPSN
jgi:hypothetical protein